MSFSNENYLMKNDEFAVPENHCVELNNGNALFINAKKDEIKLIDKSKKVQLVITVKESGLVIDINAAKLNIHAEEELNLTGKKINIKATDQLHIKSAGNLVQQIEKDALSEVGGTNKMLAAVQKITATLGEVVIKANDDVILNGERVKLNCD